ncbi:MAG: hypothetical protein AAFY28_18310, partial [Actinomycetota bacterium]
MNEIERAFVVETRSDVEPHLARAVRCTALRQGYVAIDDPGGGHVEVRVRSTDDQHLLTVKGGVGLTRTEVEVPIDAAQASALWPLAGDRVIEKLRYTVPLDTAPNTGVVEVEIDVYSGRFAGLVMTELEFADAATAMAFEPPPWFGTEVTDDARWGNANLARHGRRVLVRVHDGARARVDGLDDERNALRVRRVLGGQQVLGDPRRRLVVQQLQRDAPGDRHGLGQAYQRMLAESEGQPGIGA